MTLDELRTFMRNILETDITDLPNGTADVFLQDSFDRIVDTESRWPGYEVSDTLVTVNGTQTYSPNTTWADLASVTDSIWGPLDYLSNEEGEARFSGLLDVTGRPCYWSLWGQQIKMWPRPDGIYTLALRGFRAPVDWVALGAGAEPDLPRSFDTAIAFLATSLAYGQIEDTELAAFYEAKGLSKMASAKGFVLNNRHHRPLKLNGSRRSSGLSYADHIRGSASSQF